jgi:hypothetical protein
MDRTFDNARRKDATLSSEENMCDDGIVASEISIRIFNESIRAAPAVTTKRTNEFTEIQ